MTPAEPLAMHGLVLERRGEPPRIEALTVDPPGPGEVRVRMTAAGICHTDLAAVRDARSVPLLLGHEGAGVVEAVGPGVRDLAVGMPVVLAWKAPCGRCRRCRSGANDLCESGMAVAAPRVRRDGEPLDLLLGTGCFAEYVVVPAGSAVPAPAALPPEEAALVGCAAATGVGAVLWTARVPAGATVAVWGAGGVGICVIAGARMAGAGAIVAVEPDPARRSEAMARGATAVTDPDRAAETIAAATDGRGLDFAFEVVGTVATMEHALAALGRGGELVLVGAAARDAELRFRPRAFMSLQQRITSCIYGSVRPAVELPVLLGWAADGTLRLGELIGARIAFDDLPGAFAAPPPGIRTVVDFAA